MFTEEAETVKLIREAVYQAESAVCQPDLMILELSSNLSPHLYVADFEGSFHPSLHKPLKRQRLKK